MSALTSLLARDRVLSVSKIEEALQQQVLSGGDIETILLEMNLVPEDVLSAYRAAVYGLLPATREEVMRASREARQQVPSEMARSLGVVPILFEGRSLVVAAAEPLSEALIRQIRTQLGCDLSVRIVTPIRLAIALAHHFGFEMDARSKRLAEALRKREPGVIPYVRPPSPSLKPSLKPGMALTSFGDEPDSREFQVLPAPQSPEQPPQFLAHEAAEMPAPEQETPATQTEPAPPPSTELEAGDAPPLLAPVDSKAPTPSELLLAESSAALAMPRPPREGLLAGFQVERSTTMPPNTVSPQIARAVRGPIAEERANDLLDQVTQRDDALFVLLRYAQQFFDIVAIFSIGKDGARGRMAHGVGLSQELMERLVIPLEGNGLVARAVRDKRALIADWGASDEERAALALLGRPAGRPGLAIPIVLGTRVALLVFADRLGEGLSLEDAGPLLGIAPAVGSALRRIIVEQKTLQRTTSRPPASERGTASEPVFGHEAASECSETPAASPSTELGSGQPEPEVDVAPAVTTEALAEGFDARDVSPSAPSSGQGASTEGLVAVDLYAVSRSSGERRRNAPESMPAVSNNRVSPEQREAARGRVPGVPRSAPPPPLRDSGAPPPSASSVGAYSFVASSGAVMEESIRASRPVSLATSATASIAQPAPHLASAGAAALPASVPVAVEPLTRPETPEPPRGLERSSGRPAARLSLVTEAEPVPSVIIDMGEHVNALIDVLLRAAPNDPLGEIGELLKIGEGVLPVLMQHFPGPLWFDARQNSRRRPRGRDVSAVARCVVAFGDRAAPYLASKLTTSEPDICRYALMVAAEIVHPYLLDAVARRAFDANDAVRSVALEVLRTYTVLPQFESVLKAICELSARPGKDARRQRLAMEALLELRDARALQTLIARLSDADEEIVHVAHRALVLLTGQDFAFSLRKWEVWADENRGQHRVEWLITSLGHTEESIRALAGEELKQLTQQYFGYQPSLPKRDRDLAQRKYREWWEHEGRALFSG